MTIRYIGHTDTHKCDYCPNTVYLPRTTRYVSRTTYVCVECMAGSLPPIAAYTTRAIEHYSPRVVFDAYGVKVLNPVK